MHPIVGPPCPRFLPSFGQKSIFSKSLQKLRLVRFRSVSDKNPIRRGAVRCARDAGSEQRGMWRLGDTCCGRTGIGKLPACGAPAKMWGKRRRTQRPRLRLPAGRIVRGSDWQPAPAARWTLCASRESHSARRMRCASEATVLILSAANGELGGAKIGAGTGGSDDPPGRGALNVAEARRRGRAFRPLTSSWWPSSWWLSSSSPSLPSWPSGTSQ